MRGALVGLFALFVGCAPGQGAVYVTVTGNVQGIDHFHLQIDDLMGRVTDQNLLPQGRPVALPQTFTLLFGARHKGHFALTITAFDAGDKSLAHGTAEGEVQPSQSSELAIELTGDASDGGVDWAVPLDTAAALDLTPPIDSAAPPDLAPPPDLAIPPDTAIPPDLTTPIDAAIPPDLTTPVDAAMPPDMASHCLPNPCKNGGSCTNLPDDFMCNCFGGWSGKTCTTCNPTLCSSNVSYFKGRFITCAGASGFMCQGGPNTSCLNYCASWMGCDGSIGINQDGWATITGTGGACH